MTKPTDIGPNRTGIGTSPRQSKEAIESAREGMPHPSFDTRAHHKYSVGISRQAEPLGTLPPPASVKGVAKTMLQGMKGRHPSVFLDALGERAAFERTGVRLYESLLCRYDASHPHESSPPRMELERIRDEELAHFHLVVKAIERLGADPTAVTPSADVTGMMGDGLVKVVADPRTTLTAGLKAILVAELADNDGWTMLAALAEKSGQDQMAHDFRRALDEEQEHLRSVRLWLQNSVAGQLGVEPQAVPEQPQPGP